MAVNVPTTAQTLLYYKILAKEQASLINKYNDSYNSYSTQNDISPYLNLYGNSSSSSVGTMLNTFFMFIMQLLVQLLTQNKQVACSGNQNCTTNNNTATNTEKGRNVVTLTKDNANSDLRKQSGTSYVVVCGEGCGRCTRFSPVLKSVNNALNKDATFYSLNYDKQKDLFLTLKKESGADSSKSYGFPIIIKCVDGKATEFYSYSDISNFYTDETKMEKWFADKM